MNGLLRKGGDGEGIGLPSAFVLGSGLYSPVGKKRWLVVIQ